MNIVNLEEMKEIERKSIEEFGFSERMIIENVGLRGADFLEASLLESYDFGEVVFLIGHGNNGADGLAIARHLTNRGHRCRAFILFPDETSSEENEVQLKMAHLYGVKVSEIRSVESLDTYFTQTQSDYLVIDGVLGTGIRLPLSNYLFDLIEVVNRHASYTVAIDIATGITGSEGQISSTAIKADLTLAIGLPKVGHYVSAGARHTGDVVVIDAGFPHKVLDVGDRYLLTLDLVYDRAFERSRFAHKNSFGHTLLVGGSQGLTGALLMASEAALKCGTGLVTAATWTPNYGELVSRVIPEIMTGVIPTEREEVGDILKDLSRYDSIVIGPGLGRHEKARAAVVEVLNNFYGPVVVDADAIRVLNLKDDLEIFQKRKGPTIFTPHVGEFAGLVNRSVEEVLEDPLGYLREFVDETNSCLILKGPCTYLGFPNGKTFINYFPNDGMASGGSGDVLAGILGGMVAQYMPERPVSGIFEDKEMIYHSLCLGVVSHTLAGKHAASRMGVRAMTAGSIIESLSDAFKELSDEQNRELEG